MKKIQLDKEEQELLDAYERGEFQSTLTPSRKKFIEESATRAFKSTSFDYTKWHQEMDEALSVEEISSRATSLRHKKT